MASSYVDAQDRFKLYKFTKILSLKVAQIVVQSRQGKTISHNIINTVDDIVAQNNLQWFNLSIPDVPEVNTDTKKVLNGEVIEALSNVLCIEILLHTNDGDEMVLEMWTVRMIPGCINSVESLSTIYYRMSIMLKSTLSISRITPAYKMARSQNKDSSYKISHKIYGGQPNVCLLGENHKNIKVSQLHMPIGIIQIEVGYRTNMTMQPDDKQKSNNKLAEDIMLKSDHFSTESPRNNNSPKRSVDLTKPLTPGAFVDADTMKELNDQINKELPPWLLVEKEKMEKRIQQLSMPQSFDNHCGVQQPCGEPSTSNATSSPSKPIDIPKPKENDACCSKDIEAELTESSPTTMKQWLQAKSCDNQSGNEAASTSAASSSTSKPEDVQKPINSDNNKETQDPQKYTLMKFPFAEGSPIAELANFYQDCLEARSFSEELLNDDPMTNSDLLSEQLKEFEEAVPEFEKLLASMCSQAESNDS